MSVGEEGQAERPAELFSVSNRRVRAKQVEVLYDQLHVAISATIAAAFIMASVLWSVTAHETLLAWLATFALQTAFRWGTQYLYKHSDSQRNIDNWLVVFLVGVGFSGATWGAAIPLLVPEGSMLYLGFIVLWVCGLCAGAIASLSVHRGAFYIFILPALLPATVEFLLSNSNEEVTIGAGILIYLGFISFNSQRMHHTLMQNLKLQFKNEQLIHHLDAERKRIEGLNDQLERKALVRTFDLSRINMQLQKEVRQRKRVEQVLRTHVRHLENINQITMVMGETFDPDQLLNKIVSRTRHILKADRVWLLYPCSCQSKSWRIPVESTAEEYSGLFAAGGEIPTNKEIAQRFSEALEADTLVVKHTISDPIAIERQFSVRSQMFIALRPQFGEPWLLGVHQCSRERYWTDEEQRLFKDIAVRLINLLSATFLQRKLTQSEERLRLALMGARVGLWDWNICTGETYFSPLWQNQLGFEAGEVRPHVESWKSRIHPQDSTRVFEELDEYLKGSTTYFETEYRLQNKVGGWIWVQTRGEVVDRDPHGAPLRAVGTQIDISQRKHTEEKLRLDAVVFENTSEGVVITDAAYRILAVNRAFTDITGYLSSEVLSKAVPEILHLEDKGECYPVEFRDALTKRGYWQGEIVSQRKNGESYPQWTNIGQVRGSSGSVSHYFFVFSDITAFKDSQKRLEHLAHHDPLTNLPNRLLFSMRLEHALKRSRREGEKVAVLFLDLDRFKHVNDTLGHQAGDALLVQVAERLMHAVREEDTLARQSGDEFMILLEGMVKSRSAATVADKALKALSQPFDLSGRMVNVTGSVGISLFPDDADNAEALHENADIALYRAKERGRNNYQFYTKELTLAASKRIVLESNLRGALENEELELYFQPQLSLTEGSVTGVEALVRWRHPKFGLLLPSRFLPLAEETGLIVDIGEWVLDNACAQVSAWSNELGSRLRISVNVSLLQLLRGNLKSQLQQLISEYALSPATLELEFTESVFLNQTAQPTQVLRDLGALGVSLAVDDFGKALSSLSALRQFKPDTLKIDQSFVHSITLHANDLAMVGTITSLARSMNVKVVAECVETSEQLRLLRDRGCDLAQGFLFSAPLSASEFIKYVTRGQIHIHGMSARPGQS